MTQDTPAFFYFLAYFSRETARTSILFLAIDHKMWYNEVLYYAYMMSAGARQADPP